MGAPRYTREVAVSGEDKVFVKILPESNTEVVIGADCFFALTLEPRAAHQLGQALVQASRIAAMNVLDPAPHHHGHPAKADQ